MLANKCDVLNSQLANSHPVFPVFSPASHHDKDRGWLPAGRQGENPTGKRRDNTGCGRGRCGEGKEVTHTLQLLLYDAHCSLVPSWYFNWLFQAQHLFLGLGRRQFFKFISGFNDTYNKSFLNNWRYFLLSLRFSSVMICRLLCVCWWRKTTVPTVTWSWFLLTLLFVFDAHFLSLYWKEGRYFYMWSLHNSNSIKMDK